jgi:ferredoxin
MSASDPTSSAESPQPPRRSGRLPGIDPKRCTGCGWCVAACELHLLSLETRRWVKVSVLQEPERCTGCNLCAVRCPFHAITLRRPDAARD